MFCWETDSSVDRGSANRSVENGTVTSSTLVHSLTLRLNARSVDKSSDPRKTSVKITEMSAVRREFIWFPLVSRSKYLDNTSDMARMSACKLLPTLLSYHSTFYNLCSLTLWSPEFIQIIFNSSVTASQKTWVFHYEDESGNGVYENNLCLLWGPYQGPYIHRQHNTEFPSVKRVWWAICSSHCALLGSCSLLSNQKTTRSAYWSYWISPNYRDIFFLQWLFQLIQGPGLLFSSVIIFTQTTGLLGREISPSQGLYLNTGQHKQNKHIHAPNIHALGGIRTHDPSIRASENHSCLRPRGYCDRHRDILPYIIIIIIIIIIYYLIQFWRRKEFCRNRKMVANAV
jgi:hypothetical protein